MTIRSDAPPYGRQYSLSHDSGETWSKRLNVQVPDSPCKGGVVQDRGNNALVLSTAASCVDRVNQTIFLSLENGAPGSWLYRQPVDPESGYSTLQMTNVHDGLIANLYEQNTCNLTLALIDPKALIAAGPATGAISCQDSHCPRPDWKRGPAHPPPPPSEVDPHTAYCRAPPAPPAPPPSVACQRVLDAICAGWKSCFSPPVYADYAPLVARDSLSCDGEPPKPSPHALPVGSCPGVVRKPAWRCYSHLALDRNGSGWANSSPHPNAYCSSPGEALQKALLESPCAALH